MLYKGEHLTLIGFLCSSVVAKITKTPFFGGPYLRLIDYFEVVSTLYTAGVVLGRARRNKLDILEKLLFVPGADYKADRIMRTCTKDAKKNLERFKKEFGREPDAIYDFTFYQQLEHAVRAEGISLSPQDAFEAYLRGDKKLKRLLDEKIDLEMAEPRIMVLTIQGICFGASFPELTERMYQKGKSGEDAWTHRLVIPEELKVMSLEEAEEWILQLVAIYTSRYYPELVAPLDLGGFLEQNNLSD